MKNWKKFAPGLYSLLQRSKFPRVAVYLPKSSGGDKKGREYMPEMMPWSEKYRRYEIQERLNAPWAQAPPGNERPKTPTKRKRDSQSA